MTKQELSLSGGKTPNEATSISASLAEIIEDLLVQKQPQ